MTICGIFLFAPLFVVFLGLTSYNFSVLLLLPTIAVFFMLSYLVTNKMQKVLPVFKNIFEVFEDWAEFLVGINLGILILIIAKFFLGL
jgi:hypothetical protein